MGLRELIIMLKYDSKQFFRLRQVSGKREKAKGIQKNIILLILFSVIMFIIGYYTYTLFILLKPIMNLKDFIPYLAILFNFVFIMSIIGYIMTSVTSVHNVERIEYLLAQPVSLKTIFTEKLLIYSFYGSFIYLLIGIPVYGALGAAYNLFATPIFVLYFIALQILLVLSGASIGGLFGIVIYKFLQGRRLLKQVLSGIATAIAILIGSLYYVFMYTDMGGQLFPGLLDSLLQVASNFGLSSNYSIGYAITNLLFMPFIGVPNLIELIIDIAIIIGLPSGLIYLNVSISERAHYSGWITIEKQKEKRVHRKKEWNPHPIPLIKDPVISVSAWYNIAMIRRESRVLVSYLMTPLRMAIFIFIPLFMGGEELNAFLIIPLIIFGIGIFATSYANSFVGYELVYEGTNYLNILSSGVNLKKYIKGKIYSATPFSAAVGSIIGFILLILDISLITAVPIIIILSIIITITQGGISSYYASTDGNFKADRLLLKQRGANIQPPIGFKGAILQLIVGGIITLTILGIEIFLIFTEILYAYLALPIIYIITKKISELYVSKASKRLSELEASDYL